MIEVLTSMCARLYGRRGARNQRFVPVNSLGSSGRHWASRGSKLVAESFDEAD